MKKLLSIIFLSFLFGKSTFAHIENKFVYLICDTKSFNTRYIVTIDIKKKLVKSYKPSDKETSEYNIYDTSETWIRAKNKDNENKRIIIHRYVNEAVYQEYKDNKWIELSDGDLVCEDVKKKF